LFKVILVSSAAERHNAAFYEYIKNEIAPARHRETYSMLFVLLSFSSGEAGGSLRQFIKRQNTLFKIRCWTFDVRCSSFKRQNTLFKIRCLPAFGGARGDQGWTFDLPATLRLRGGRVFDVHTLWYDWQVIFVYSAA